MTGRVFPPQNEQVFPMQQTDLQAGQLYHEEDVKIEPYIFWEYHPRKLYTLCFTSTYHQYSTVSFFTRLFNRLVFIAAPDGAKYEPPLVWLTVNIPGVAISEGQNVTDYQSPKAIVKGK